MELPVFQKYLQYVYEKTDNALPLFDYLRKFHPDYEIPDDPDGIHRIVFGKKESYPKKISNLFSDLSRNVREFLLSREMKGNAFEIKYLWLRILQKRGLKNEFIKASKQLYEETETKTQKGFADYFQNLVASHVYDYECNLSGPNVDAAIFQKYTDNIDVCYALFRFSTACEMASLNRSRGGRFNLEKMAHVEAIIPPDQLTAHPLLHLYVSVYQLLQTYSDDAYETLEALFREYASLIAPEECIRLLSYPISYGAVRVREEAFIFKEKSYLLIKFIFEKGVFAHSGAMPSTLFNNIIHITCKARQFDWAREFIQQQIPYLEPAIQSDTRIIAEATLLCEQGKYADTIAYLSKCKFQDVMQFMRANTMILISIYEMRSETMDIDKVCENFQKYLYNHKKKKMNSAQIFLNFIRILRLLLRGADSQETIELEIKKGPVAQRDWLLEKVKVYKPTFAARKRRK